MANQKRLIDANALKDALRTNEGAKALGHSVHRLFCVDEIIDEAPTVDAVEVVHGRWLDIQETETYVPDMKFTITKTAETCSNCKARIGFVGAKQYLFDAICPNCGAKMDGERRTDG